MVYKRNIISAEWTDSNHGEQFAVRRKSLTPHGAGFAPRLGMSLYRLEPGKRAFPAHYHMANDEAILVLDGRGSLRLGNEMIPLEQGDYIHLPAGQAVAHQVINDSDGPLDYLCLSSMIAPEIMVYPDSGKIGVMAGAAPGGDPKARLLSRFLKDVPVDYWDGEG